jgi:Zn-dependent protease
MFGSFDRHALRFELLGFPVRVDPSFWILSALLGLGLGDMSLVALWIVVLFASVLVHELAHALAFRQFGIESEIVLYSMGGQTRPRGSGRLAPWHEIVVSASGPLIEIGIGGAVWSLTRRFGWPEDRTLANLVWFVMWVNLVWGALNLLPIVPLDGGHVMESAVSWVRGRRDELLPALVSVLVGASVAGVALVYGERWGAMLAVLFTARNVQVARAYRPIPPRDLWIAGGVMCVLGAALGYWIVLARPWD